MSTDPPTITRRRRSLYAPAKLPLAGGGNGNANGNGHRNGHGNGNGNGSGGGLPPTRGGRQARTGGSGGHGDAPVRRRRASLYRPRRKRRSRAVRITIILMLVLAVLAGGGVAVVFAGYNYYKAQLPDTQTVASMEPAQDSYVYDAAGKLIHVYHGPADAPTARHTHVALANVSRWARLATVDIEDRHFYSEGSWDLPRLMSAAVNDVLHRGATQGASTITEQLAKLSFAGNSTPRSLDYKVKEIVLGNEIAANFTKDQILEMYLNRIYYGNFAVGIQTAAQLYFMVDASRLDLAQASMLAGLPQSPSYYNPFANQDASGVNPLTKQRQLEVLNAMVSNGDITQAQANAAFKERLTFHLWTESEPNTDGSFVQYLTSYLNAHFGDAYIQPGGWRIQTTLNPGAQAAAEQVVHDQVAANAARFNMNDAALVSIDPRSGEVLDMVGAWDANDPYFGQLNMATTRLNPGSSVKLFTYTAAIASGKYSMTTPIVDAPTTFQAPGGSPYKPLNYDRRWHGVCELKICLGNSLNVPAVKVEVGTGIPYITSLAYAAGVSWLSPGSTCVNAQGQTVNNDPGQYDFAATLGFYNCGITLLDLANGASTIANLGVEHDATPVLKITDVAGHVVYTYDPGKAGRQVVPSNVAFIINQITSNDNNRASEFGRNGLLTIPGRRVSAKTGTGEGGTGNGFMDNLTVGWTPEFLTAVWVGNPSPWCGSFLPQGEPCGTLNGIASGITGAAPIWNQFMNDVLPSTPNDWYAIPRDVIQRGSGLDADFFLPSSQTNPSGGCYYWGPAPEPGNACQYTGTSPPPWYTGSGGITGSGGGNGNGDGNGNGNGGHNTPRAGPPTPPTT